MAHEIHKTRVRQALQARREPYWATPLEPGRFIGFRKIDALRGSWIARAHDPAAGKHTYRSVGKLSSTLDYDAACAAAREWFRSLDAGVRTKGRFTIADACQEYIEELRRAKRDKAADDAEWRFKRGGISDGGAFGAIEVTKLHAPALKKWRDGLMAEETVGQRKRQMTQAGVNRMMTALRAALNLAVQNRRVSATAAQEWRAVKQYKAADGRREIFLDLEQRRALLAAATGAVRDLIEAALLTGARPGELAALTRKDFDGRTQTLKLAGKTGPRTIPLEGAALTLFERLAKSRLPAAPLLPRPDGKPWTRIEWSRQIRAAGEAATVKGADGKESKLPPGVCLYTCRHTWITSALGAGMSTLDVARLTGTSLGMIEKHYGQFAQSAVRARLAKVEML